MDDGLWWFSWKKVGEYGKFWLGGEFLLLEKIVRVEFELFLDEMEVGRIENS